MLFKVDVLMWHHSQWKKYRHGILKSNWWFMQTTKRPCFKEGCNNFVLLLIEYHWITGRRILGWSYDATNLFQNFKLYKVW